MIELRTSVSKLLPERLQTLQLLGQLEAEDVPTRGDDAALAIGEVGAEDARPADAVVGVVAGTDTAKRDEVAGGQAQVIRTNARPRQRERVDARVLGVDPATEIPVVELVRCAWHDELDCQVFHEHSLSAQD